MRTDMRLITSQMNELEAVDSFDAIEKYINEEVKVCLSSMLYICDDAHEHVPSGAEPNTCVTY